MAWLKNHTTRYPPAHYRNSTPPPYAYHRQFSRKKPAAVSRPTTTLWKTLKAPVIFGVGLYFGMVVFGEHQETKKESEYFEALRYMFQDKDKKKDARDENNE